MASELLRLKNIENIETTTIPIASNKYFGQIIDVNLLTATSNSLSGEIVVNDNQKQGLPDLSYNIERNGV